jgi:sporulation protein YlmC with PRC-barrel domain
MEEKMAKATMVIVASVITLFFLLTGSFAGDLLSVDIHKKNNIIGATVRNIQGEKLGEISNLTFDKDTGNITYVILSHVGITSNGEKLTPVPLDALRFINEKNAHLDISKERLDSSPFFEKEIFARHNRSLLEQ